MGRPKKGAAEKRKEGKDGKGGGGANLGFEPKLWAAADKLRGHMDAAEYKSVALGLIFLKYISDAFQERFEALLKEPHANPEDRDEYLAENVFWVPPEARWNALQDAAKQPDIGRRVDRAMEAIERENPSLKGVLPKDYARPTLDQTRLGELIDLFGKVELVGARDDAGLFDGRKDHRSKDLLGRVYEYFLGKFAAAEGKLGGEFFTPQSVVRLLVEMIEPFRGRVLDPCCGSGGMFVQSESFVEAHGGRKTDLSIYGQESNPTTWKLCKMNLAIRGIEANLGPHHADSFHRDWHRDLKADFLLANPPFNVSDWGRRPAPRRRPLEIRRPARGKCQLRLGPALPGPPGAERRRRLRAGQRLDVVEPVGRGRDPPRDRRGRPRRLSDRPAGAVVLHDGDPPPVCGSWRGTRRTASFRDRRGARPCSSTPASWGHLVDRTHRDLADEEIARLARTYHAWRGEPDAGTYADVPDSASRRAGRRSPPTASSSPPAATSGPRTPRTTASRSPNGWPPWWPRWRSSSPSRRGWRGRSGQACGRCGRAHPE